MTLLCFSQSSACLLQKLRSMQADRQKLLIHWSDSEEDLKQLPDMLSAYLSLKEARKSIHGRHLDDALQNLRSFFDEDKKKRGRPRLDALAKRVKDLKNAGRSWGEIKIQLDRETGETRTIGAYRSLARTRRQDTDGPKRPG
jgi:hypothetical protein